MQPDRPIQPDNTEFEALMLSKSWAELSPEERADILVYVAGEEEYNLMRATLAEIRDSHDSAEGLKIDPGVRGKLSEEFDRHWIETGGFPKGKGKVVSLRRRLWLTGTAAAGFILLVASVWWLALQNLEERLQSSHKFAADKVIKHPDKSAYLPEDQGNQEITVMHDHAETHSGEAGMEGEALVLSDAKEDLRTADTNTGDWTLAFGEAQISEVDKKAGIMADSEIKTLKSVSGDRTTTTTQMAGEDHDLLQGKKTIVSERTVYAVKQMPSKDKMIMLTSRAVSEDPDLLMFLYTCF